MNVTAWIKQFTSNYFRQFLKLEKIEYCNAYKTMKSISWMEEILTFANLTFPQLVHECPYRGVTDLNLISRLLPLPTHFQTVRIVNGSFTKNGQRHSYYNTSGPRFIGNGIIKIRIAFHDEIDPKILVFDNYHESIYREAELSGRVLS
jgi:hypothetical protein